MGKNEEVVQKLKVGGQIERKAKILEVGETVVIPPRVPCLNIMIGIVFEDTRGNKYSKIFEPYFNPGSSLDKLLCGFLGPSENRAHEDLTTLIGRKCKLKLEYIKDGAGDVWPTVLDIKARR